MKIFKNAYSIFGLLTVMIFAILTLSTTIYILLVLLKILVIPNFSLISDLIKTIFIIFNTYISYALHFVGDLHSESIIWLNKKVIEIHHYNPPQNLMIIVAGIIATFIGISLPLSVGIVSQQLAPYKDRKSVV